MIIWWYFFIFLLLRNKNNYHQYFYFHFKKYGIKGFFFVKTILYQPRLGARKSRIPLILKVVFSKKNSKWINKKRKKKLMMIRTTNRRKKTKDKNKLQFYDIFLFARPTFIVTYGWVFFGYRRSYKRFLWRCNYKKETFRRWISCSDSELNEEKKPSKNNTLKNCPAVCFVFSSLFTD